MRMLTEGSWWIISKKDPRWNAHGNCLVGLLSIPGDCEKKLEELKAQYGEEPDDLECGYMKD